MRGWWRTIAIVAALTGPAFAGLAPPRRGPPPALEVRPADEALLVWTGTKPGPGLLDALVRAGATLARVDGRVLTGARWLPVRATRAVRERLARIPGVLRIERVPARKLPLDRAATQLHLAQARGARPAGAWLTGEGVLLGDLDANVDVLHPAFFRADAGWYDWLDVDGDQTFRPGVDAIDLNADGIAQPEETARPQRAQTTDYYGEPVKARAEGFDPAVDWLYLDDNGNGQRDAGARAGFGDDAPAYGEPLFVPDDLDRSGRLDPGERVARLGSSKFRKVFLSIGAQRGPVHVFERGVDLSSLEADYTGGSLYGMPDASHGTGVSHILVGDVPLAGRRWVGLAPDADVVLSFSTNGLDGHAWLEGEKPDVALHEYVEWTDVPLDGSDASSVIIDEWTAQGIASVCPAGNIGGARKHARLEPDAAGPVVFPFEVPRSGPDPTNYLQLSVHVQGAKAGAIRLTFPDGHEVALPVKRDWEWVEDDQGPAYLVTSSTTSRGTQLRTITLYLESGLEAGDWKVQVALDAAAIADGYLSDNLSGFGEGVAFPAGIASDSHTVAAPATADTCLSVGAYGLHATTEGEWFWLEGDVLDVRPYSARGPRLDGLALPEILAPDNPWAAATAWPGSPWLQEEWVGLSPFGGTSGAGPHVAGVAALAVQAGLHGRDALDAVRRGAVVDAHTGAVPNDATALGRLDAAGALGAGTQGDLPHVAIRVVEASDPVTSVRLELDTDGTEARWDEGYDGTFEGAWVAPTAHDVPRPTRPWPVRVRVRNAAGLIAEAMVRVAPDAAPGEPGSGGDAGGCGCGSAGAGLAFLGLLATARRSARRARSRASR